MTLHTNSFEQLPQWHTFIKQHALNELQIKQFSCYIKMLRTYNELFNLTAITDPADIISFHFEDSLALGNYVDCNAITMIADVGTGAGFPGIPLKIMYPHMAILLIEVTKKKIEFLTKVIAALQLDGIRTFEIDWRTFLRKTDEPVDLFVSRASLQPSELIRMFRNNCPYNTKQLVYWASKDWKKTAAETPYLRYQKEYKINNKLRQLVFLMPERTQISKDRSMRILDE